MERKGRVVMGKIVGAMRARFSNNVGIGVDAMLETESVGEVEMFDNLHVAPGQEKAFEVFLHMQQAIQNLGDTQTRGQLHRETVLLAQSVGTPSYTERYQKFVSLAADHWTLLGPFVPVLAKFLGA